MGDLLEEKEEMLREAEQLKQRIADLEKEVIVWKKASENNSYRALLLEDKYNKQKEINQELVEENDSLKTQIKKMECLSEKRIADLEEKNSELRNRNSELAGQKASLERWYGEAKELLTKWVELFSPKGGNIPPTPIQVETEKFISKE